MTTPSIAAGPELAVPLNRSEYGYVTLGGLAGTINQVYTVRFDAPIEIDHMRRALRRLISAQPRLRGVVEPTWRTYQFRILPDDAVVDQLFDVAFRVVRGIDVNSREALENYAGELLNDPVSLERGLGLRFGFMPDAATPVLVISVEHTLGDGRSMMMWVNAIIKLLNGQEIPTETKVDDPSMIAAIAPLRLLDWPRCVLASWRHKQEAKRMRQGRNLCMVDTEVLPRITAHAVRYHTMSVGADVIKAAAKKTGASINTFLMTALAQALLQRRADDPQALASIRLSVDLRPYFPKDKQPGMGNYVASFSVHETHGKAVEQLVKSIDAQMREGLARYERREMIFPWLPAELIPMLGRRLYVLLALRLRRADALSAMSCHFTTVGDMSWINPKDARIKMAEFFPTVPSTGPLFATSSFNGKQVVMLCYQRDRTTRENISRFIDEVDATVVRMVQASGVLDAPAPPAAAAPAAQPAVA